MTVDLEDATLYRISLSATASTRWKVKLKDREGRSSKVEETLAITVQPNHPPELKPEKASDVSVSPLEELSVGAKLRDDFGLVRAGISYSLVGGETSEQILLDKPPVKVRFST